MKCLKGLLQLHHRVDWTQQLKPSKGQDDIYCRSREDSETNGKFWQMFLIFRKDKNSDVRGQTFHVALSSSKQSLDYEPSLLWLIAIKNVLWAYTAYVMLISNIWHGLRKNHPFQKNMTSNLNKRCLTIILTGNATSSSQGTEELTLFLGVRCWPETGRHLWWSSHPSSKQGQHRR